MKRTDPPEDPFIQAVRQQAERARRRHGGFWHGLAVVGVVGWLVALPAVGGAFLGRWLDRLADTGIRWTLGLLVLGLGVGCAAAWRHVQQGMDE
jgi:ATP synthase protein I